VKVGEGTAGSKGRLHFSAPVEGQESLLTWKDWVVEAAKMVAESGHAVLVKTKTSQAGNVRVEGLTRLNRTRFPMDPEAATDIPF
jgi:hypothetical protein